MAATGHSGWKIGDKFKIDHLNGSYGVVAELADDTGTYIYGTFHYGKDAKGNPVTAATGRLDVRSIKLVSEKEFQSICDRRFNSTAQEPSRDDSIKPQAPELWQAMRSVTLKEFFSEQARGLVLNMNRTSELGARISRDEWVPVKDPKHIDKCMQELKKSITHIRHTLSSLEEHLPPYEKPKRQTHGDRFL